VSTKVDPVVDAAVDLLAASLDSTEAMDRLLWHAVSVSNADRATLVRVEGDQVVVEAACANEGPSLPRGSRWQVAGQPHLREVIAGRRPMQFQEINLDVLPPEVQTAYARLRHVVSVPFGTGQGAECVLAVIRNREPAFSEAEIDSVEKLAKLAALALRNATLYRSVQAAQRRSAIALEAAEEAAAQTDVRRVLAHVVQRAGELVGAQHATLTHLQDGRLIVDYSTTPMAAPGSVWPMVPSLERALEQRRLMVVPPEELLRTSPQLSGQVTEELRNVVLPLLRQDELVGILAVARIGQAFTDEEISALQEYGPLAAALLRNAMLLEQSQVKEGERRRLQAGIDVALALGASLDVREVIRRLLEQTLGLMEADRVTLSSVDAERITIEASVDTQESAAVATWIGRSYPLEMARDQPTVHQALTTREPVVGGQLNVNEAAPELRDGLSEMHSTVVLPLERGKQLLALLVVSRRPDRPFQADEVATLKQIGSIAVLALTNARLFDQVQEASRSKSQFLNLVAHELRTPLSVIRGYLSLMEDGTLEVPEATKENAVRILTQKADELSSLVDDLLASARLQSGSLTVRPEASDVVATVRQAVERARPRLALLKASLDADLPPDPMIAMVDPESLGRILDNLINNALTYTAGPAHIAISVRTNQHVEVRVTDRGYGIARQNWERIFEPFVRLSDHAQSRPGAGIGLSISRDLAAQNSATLRVEESTPGKGTTFLLTLRKG
jgi:signal transduction histidine kinase